MVYLDFCDMALQHFSRKFLCIYIIADCLSLAYDKVANIRRKLATMLVAVRQRIRPNDKENLKLFAEIVCYLKKDFDIDVNEVRFLLSFSRFSQYFYSKFLKSLKFPEGCKK